MEEIFMWAIIGGSGFENFESGPLLDRSTPFGLASSGLRAIRINQQECLFISRHGEHHEQLPSEVNFLANIWALKKHGARAVLSLSAVGSLQPEYQPGDMVIPLQYIDRTKGLRRTTFCGDGVVGHVSLAHPVANKMAELTMSLTESLQFSRHLGQTYICIEGPTFSTQAESKLYRSMGGDIIGMTHFPEYALAREAGLAYLPCCFITDYDCWDDSIPHVTLEGVIQTMRDNNAKAFQVAELVVSSAELLQKAKDDSRQGLKTGLLTPLDHVPSSAKEWLSVILSE